MSKRIVIEGMDGTGKSTIAREVVERLLGLRISAKLVAYPTDGAVGRFVRSILSGQTQIASIKAMLPLFIADAVDQEHVVGGYLDRDYHIVMDRHPMVSAFAFQVDHHAGHNILHAYHAFELSKPDLLFILDAPAEVAFDRCKGRGKYEDAIYKESLENLQRLRSRYRDIATTPHPARPEGPGSRGPQRTWLVDGTLPLEEVVQFIVSRIGGEHVRG